MIRLRSIRFRLAIWYTSIVLVGLVVLGSIMWLGVNSGITASMDQQLTDRLEGIVKPLANEAGFLRGRMQALIENPQLANSLLPEMRKRLELSVTEQDRVKLVNDAIQRLTQDRMRTIAGSLPAGELLEIRNAAGETIAGRAENKPEAKLLWPEDGAREPVFRTLSIDGAGYRVMVRRFVVDGRSYRFLTATSVKPLQSVRRETGKIVYWAAPLFLALSALGGYLISSRALAPVDQMTRTAQSISIEDLSHRLTVPRTGDELERLAVAWNGMLERLAAAVGRLARFTADASHELRTPTAVIHTTAELALRRERSPDEYREALRKIGDQTGHMTQLLEDLLTLARSDAGPSAIPLVRVDLADLTRSISADYRVLAEAKGLRFHCTVPGHACLVRGHEPALRRLMVVLLDNSIKYTQTGGSVSVSLRPDKEGIEMEVEDTGTGIAVEELPRIFERFYRADASRNRSTGGFGLGLSVAKSIADTHRARISVFSREGQGSTFKVSFPQFLEKA